MSAHIAFKEHNLVTHWQRLHPRLVEVLQWIADEVYPVHLHQRYMLVTSLYRPDGIHALYRAADLSVRDYITRGVISHAKCTRGAAAINDAWDYGKEPYQVCLYHVGSEWHYHVQVRDETKQRDPQ